MIGWRAYAAIGAILLVVTGSYLKGRRDGDAACAVRIALLRAESAEAKDAEAQRAHEAAVRLEKANAKTRIVYRDIVRDVERIVDRPVYRDTVCIDDDGLRAVNRALAGPGAVATEPDAAMPRPDPAR